MKYFFILFLFLFCMSSVLPADSLETGDIVVYPFKFNKRKNKEYVRAHFEIQDLYKRGLILQTSEKTEWDDNVVYTIIARQGVVDHLNEISQPNYKGNIELMFNDKKLNSGKYLLIDDNDLMLFINYQELNGEKIFSVSNQHRSDSSSARFNLNIKDNKEYLYSENKGYKNFLLGSKTYLAGNSTLTWVSAESLPDIHVSLFAYGRFEDKEIKYAKSISESILDLIELLKNGQENSLDEESIKKILSSLKFILKIEKDS